MIGQIIFVISCTIGLVVVWLLYMYKERIWEQQLAQQKLELLYKEEQIARQALKLKEDDYERTKLQSIVKTQNEERKRFAADLHDALSGEIVALLLYIGSLELDPKAQQKLTTDVRKLVNSVREISYNIMPPTLQHFGLKTALEEFCDQLDEQKQLLFNFEWIGKDCDQYDLDTQLSIYYIAKELVTNAIKHARASTIWLKIHHSKEAFKLEVRDNGIGTDPTTIRGGNGIKNIQDRAFYIGAELVFSNQEGEGLTVCLIKKYKS